MTEFEQPPRERRPRSRHRTWPLVLVGVALAAVVFAVGVAFGMALGDDPEPGGTVTLVRTLEPRPQTPAATP